MVPATTLDASREDAGHFRPQFLPGGRQFLFLVQSRKGANTGIYDGSLDSKDTKPILLGVPTPAYYVPSGQILFMRNSALFAQDFDLKRLEVHGEVIRVADSVFFVAGNAAFSAFSVSETGILAYRTGDSNQGRQSQLAWFDRQGTRLETVGSVGRNRNPRLSPDGTRVAVQIEGESGGSVIWVLGPGTTSSRVAAPAVFPVWSADGTRLVYGRYRDGKAQILQKRVAGESGEEEILGARQDGHIDDLSTDGKYVVLSVINGATNRDVIAVPLGSDQKPVPIAATAANELFGRISPDGRWIAYESNESGRQEVYLQAFPRAGSKMLISRNGGTWPAWRRDGRELFYISSDPKKLMSVSISGSATLQPATPQPLFDISITGNSGIGTPSHYDVSPDGQRFLIATAAGDTPEISPIHLILNWPELLKR